jgi:pilus assembly protein Flp/PilA
MERCAAPLNLDSTRLLTLAREIGGRKTMCAKLRIFLQNESGATAIEYGLIAALIAVVIITGVTAVGTSLSTTFNTISGSLK